MKKVKNANQAIEVFQLLGIKDVTKDWQRSKGTKVFELPFKTMYANGYTEVNRFSIYKSGYVRKMLVNSKGASYCCYQLNRTRVAPKYYKDYDFDGNWTGKYNRYVGKERIMIPKYEDRLVYLCNYILKNYYRNQQGASFYRINDHQVSEIKRQSVHAEPQELVKTFPSLAQIDDVKVIINGHRYNLS
mgnify:CR=1 FL=1